MDEMLDTLCTLLEDEIERQENVRDVCMAQNRAAMARDLDGLEARTTALELLIRDAIRAQGRRHEVLGPLVHRLGLPADRQTLSDLIAAAPEPWRSRLRELQRRIRTTVSETRRAVRSNACALRRSMRVADGLLRALHADTTLRQDVYGDRGIEPRQLQAGRDPAWIDERG